MVHSPGNTPNEPPRQSDISPFSLWVSSVCPSPTSLHSMGSVRLLSSSFSPVVTPDPSSYHPPTLQRRLLCHLLITTLNYLPSPAITPSFMHNITTHFTVRPLLCLSTQIRRFPMVSYAYKAQWSLQNTHPVD
jgi:hypothetical protein